MPEIAPDFSLEFDPAVTERDKYRARRHIDYFHWEAEQGNAGCLGVGASCVRNSGI